MRHHYIPQFLLRPWVNASDNKLEEFWLHLKPVSSARCSPKATGYQDNLYALNREEVAGVKRQDVEESFLQKVDSSAAIVRDKLDKEGLQTLSLDERNDWVKFLMSLRCRQPGVIDMVRLGQLFLLSISRSTQLGLPHSWSRIYMFRNASRGSDHWRVSFS